MRPTLAPAALLLDLDGCVVAGSTRPAIPRAVEAVAALRRCARCAS